MTSFGPDELLDQRLKVMFSARADQIAAAAPTMSDAINELERRVHGVRKVSPRQLASGSWSQVTPRFASSTEARTAVRRPRMALALLAAALVVALATLLSGAGHRGIMTGPSETPSPSPAATYPEPLSAPLGYQGSGTIEFSRPNATGDSDLWLIEPAGTNERLFLAGGCCGLFSPDGRQLAVAVPGGGLHAVGSPLLGINIYTLPGSSVTSKIPAQCNGGCSIATENSAPDAWSADGTKIAAELWRPGADRTAGMAIAVDPQSWTWGGGALAPLASTPDLPIAFSPDGKALLFLGVERVIGPSSIGPLFLLDIASGSVRQLTQTGVTLSTNALSQAPASWSPDGSQIAFAATDTSTGTSRTNIYVMASAIGAKPKILVADTYGAMSAHFSPDGSWIAFDRGPVGGGFHDLFVVHPDGSGLRALTAGFNPGVCCGSWSPDGRALLVAGTSSDDNHNDLFIVPLAGEVRQVTQSAGVYIAFQWGIASR
jgi:hypothetical protein